MHTYSGESLIAELGDSLQISIGSGSSLLCIEEIIFKKYFYTELYRMVGFL